MDTTHTDTLPTLHTITMSETLDTRIALVATQCCICATALADATSVELGIGPTCRRKMAKLDKAEAVAPDWNLVTDALGDFAAVDRTDSDRIEIFEKAMKQIAIARTGGAAHTLANLITHYIAATQARPDSIGGLILAIERMGRPNLAAALRKRQYTVRVDLTEQGTLNVFSPWAESFKTAMWRGQIGRWNRDVKCYVVPCSRAHDLHAALRASYPGTRGVGPKGEFSL